MELHVGVGDFGDWGEEEDDGEEEDEGCDGEVGPLDVGLVDGVSEDRIIPGKRDAYEGAWVAGVDVEEGVGSDDGSNYGSNSLKALSGLQSEFGKTRRTTDREVRVCRDLKSLES